MRDEGVQGGAMKEGRSGGTSVLSSNCGFRPFAGSLVGIRMCLIFADVEGGSTALICCWHGGGFVLMGVLYPAMLTVVPCNVS
jgi:hypothetical protein